MKRQENPQGAELTTGDNLSDHVDQQQQQTTILISHMRPEPPQLLGGETQDHLC